MTVQASTLLSSHIALITGAVSALGASIMLWAYEGPGVFLDVLLAGISACF